MELFLPCWHRHVTITLIAVIVEAVVHFKPKKEGTVILQTSSELINALLIRHSIFKQTLILAQSIASGSIIAPTRRFLSIPTHVVGPLRLLANSLTVQGLDSITNRGPCIVIFSVFIPTGVVVEKEAGWSEVLIASPQTF